MLKPTLQQRRAERMGDRSIGADRNYGTHDSGVPLNPNFRTSSAAYYGQPFVTEVSPEAERVLRLFYPTSNKSRGR